MFAKRIYDKNGLLDLIIVLPMNQIMYKEKKFSVSSPEILLQYYRWMDDLRFTYFLKVFQSYQDDGRMTMVEEISHRAGLESGTARSVGAHITH